MTIISSYVGIYLLCTFTQMLKQKIDKFYVSSWWKLGYLLSDYTTQQTYAAEEKDTIKKH